MASMRHMQQADVSLARRLGPLSVWALSFGCIIGWGSFILPGTTFLPQAGPAGTAAALALAAVAMAVISLNYSYLIERYPVAGGEYSYVGETFGTGHAFAVSWLLGLCYLSLVAQNATALALVGKNLIGGVFQAGLLYSVAGYDIYAGELFLALGALVLFAVLCIRGVRFAGLFQTILVLAIVCGVGTVVIFDVASQGAAALAPQPAFKPGEAPVPGMLSVLAIAPFLFVGFDTIPQAAEEYSFPARKAKLLALVSIFVGAATYAALCLLAASVLPAGYADWPSYIDAVPQLHGIAALPTFNAASVLMGPPGLVLLGIAVCGAILSGIVGFYLAASRLLFAMGRDGMLPSWFAAVHPRYRTPHHALLFVLAAASSAPFFGRTVLAWLVDMSSLGAAVAYGYTSLAVLVRAVPQRQGAYVVTSVLGLLCSLTFVVLLLVPIPGLSASLGVESYVCLAVWILWGALFFCATRNTRQGGCT